ncbi:hypothetical protein DMENIID0001_069720 [Sergentomyia squamirostris]
MEPEQTEKPVTNRKPYNRGTRGKASQAKRTDDFRRRVGAEVMRETRENIPAQYTRFTLDLPDLDSRTSIAKNTSRLYVSTRGVGTGVARSYTAAVAQCGSKVSNACTALKAYRCCLLQAALRFQLARERTPHVSLAPVTVKNIFLPPDLYSVVQSHTRTFSLVANVLSGVGWLSVNDDTFVTVLHVTEDYAQRVIELLPDTLRAVITRASAPGANHAEDRSTFRALSTIPGVEYGTSDRVVNADSIVPPNWPTDVSQVIADFDAFEGMLSILQTKMPWLVSSFGLDGKAEPSALIQRSMSSDSAGCVTSVDNTFQFDIGYNESWYSRRSLGEAQFVRGALSLLGEIWNDEEITNAEHAAVCFSMVDWNHYASKATERH